MRVWGSYLTTIRNSVTVIADTSHACCPSFFRNFLLGEFRQRFLLSKRCSEQHKNTNIIWLGYSRVIHEVVDLPHGHAPYIDKKHEAEQHQIVFRGHPQNKLQVEGVQLCQEELTTDGIKKKIIIIINSGTIRIIYRRKMIQKYETTKKKLSCLSTNFFQ